MDTPDRPSPLLDLVRRVVGSVTATTASCGEDVNAHQPLPSSFLSDMDFSLDLHYGAESGRSDGKDHGEEEEEEDEDEDEYRNQNENEEARDSAASDVEKPGIERGTVVGRVLRVAWMISHLFGATFASLGADDQACILEGMLTFLRATPFCVPLCCEVGWTRKLVISLARVCDYHIFDQILELICIVGSHHFAAYEVKIFLKMLCSPVNHSTDPPSLPLQQRANLLDTMIQMAQRGDPERFFLLTGDNSGIDIECGPVDILQSYAFSVWVWVDQFQSLSPRLICFLAPNNSGVELFMTPDNLCFRANTNNIVACPFPFQEKMWYHITLCHSQPNWSNFFSAELQFFINGDLVYSTAHKFPSAGEQFRFHGLGHGGEFVNGVFQPQGNMSLVGKLSTVAMLQGVVAPHLVSSLYKKGPDFCISNSSLSGLTGTSNLIVLFCFSPYACIGRHCYNVTEEVSPDGKTAKVFWQAQRKKPHLKTRATLQEGSECVFGEHLVYSLHSAAGVKVLLPLFHPDTVGAYGPHCLSLALKLLGIALKVSEAASIEAQSTDMLRILGVSLLENVPRTFFSQEFLEGLLELVESVSRCGGTQQQVKTCLHLLTEKLQRHSYSYLLLNFGIWRAAEFSLQQLHLAQVQAQVYAQPQYFRKIFGIGAVLQVLRYYYSISPVNPSAMEASQGTQVRLWLFADLSREEIQSLRSLLCTILKSLLTQEDITKEEVAILLHYFTVTTECDELEDVLVVLQHTVANPPKMFLQHLEDLMVVHVLYSLLMKPKESLRLHALRVIGMYFKGISPRQKQKFLSDFGHHFIIEALSSYNFTLPIYHVLVEHMTDTFTEDLSKRSILLDLEEGCISVQNADVVQIVFSLLSQEVKKVGTIQEYNAMNISAINQILQHLIAVTRSNQGDFSEAILLVGPKEHVLEIVWQLQERLGSIPLESDMREACNLTIQYTLQLLAVILRQSMLMKNGWQQVETTIALWESKQNGNSSRWNALLRMLLEQMLKLVSDMVHTNEQLHNNVVNVAGVIERIASQKLDPLTGQALWTHLDEIAVWDEGRLVITLLSTLDKWWSPQMLYIQIQCGASKHVPFGMIYMRLVLLTFQEVHTSIKFLSHSHFQCAGLKHTKHTESFISGLFTKMSLRFGDVIRWMDSFPTRDKVPMAVWLLCYLCEIILGLEKTNMEHTLILVSLCQTVLQSSVPWIVAFFDLRSSGTDISLLREFAKKSLGVAAKDCPAEIFLSTWLHTLVPLSEPSLSTSGSSTPPVLKRPTSEYCAIVSKLCSIRNGFDGVLRSHQMKAQMQVSVFSDSFLRDIKVSAQTQKEKLEFFKKVEFRESQHTVIPAKYNLSNLELQRLRKSRRAKRGWRNIVKSMATDTSCWYLQCASLIAGNCSENTLWKVDQTETRMRMRRRLKVDFWTTPPKLGREQYADEQALFDPVDIVPSKNVTSEMAITGGEQWLFVDHDISKPDEISEEIGETVLFNTQISLVLPSGPKEGKLVVTPLHILLFFEQFTDYHRWLLSSVKEIHARRYILFYGLEIFVDQRSLFIVFPQKKIRNDAAECIVQSIKMSTHSPIEWVESPRKAFKRANWLQRWQQREISNFEYLMKLNTFAGRTYNDLSQYPVMPWVLNDYISSSIDLSDPSVFRDLSKPVGALNQERLEHYWRRYREIEQDRSSTVDPFLYGSHYSTIGSVLYWLIRLEPFSGISREIQGGCFDIPDRVFHSIFCSWDNSLHASSDVKELIPEFFYCPDFLLNVNKYNLGVNQTGIAIGNVELPRWATSPDDFIHKHRSALESDYVSSHLHEWIDLIFGYKQRGKDAIAANNVFYYLTYSDTLQFAQLDALHIDALKVQIQYYGQCPSQLFTKPHPARGEAPISIINMPSTFILKVYASQALKFCPEHIFAFSDHIVVLAHNASNFSTFLWSTAVTQNMLLHFTLSEANISYPHSFNILESIKHSISSPVFMHNKFPGCLVFTSNWNRSFCCLHGSPSIVKCIDQEVSSVVGTVTCITLCDEGTLACIGGSSGCSVLWGIQASQQIHFFTYPQHVLRGHKKKVTAAAIDLDLDICVTGAKDGFIVHTIKKGRALRHITVDVKYIKISKNGDIITASASGVLSLYSINGRLQQSTTLMPNLCALLLASNAFVITGTATTVFLLDAITLRVLHRLELQTQYLYLSHMALSPDQRHVFLCMSQPQPVPEATTPPSTRHTCITTTATTSTTATGTASTPSASESTSGHTTELRAATSSAMVAAVGETGLLAPPSTPPGLRKGLTDSFCHVPDLVTNGELWVIGF
ncbi:binding protein [Pelomyxa schiedti]|nr:binding protein [Pelomyxa schiedti]